MNSEKIKIIFIHSYKIDLLKDNFVYFKSNEEEKIYENNITKKIELNPPQKQYRSDLEELIIEKKKVLEINKNIIKLLFILENKKNKNKKCFEVNINFEPSRTNFIFDFKIGNLVNGNTISKFNENFNLDFNELFVQFYNYINYYTELKNQPEMLECLAEDLKKNLEKKKNQNNSIYFDAIFFLLIYSKNKDIQLLLELIKKRNLGFKEKIFKAEDIVSFCNEIFNNYENDENSWPFDEIKRFDNDGNDEEEQEEKENEEKEEKNNKIKTNNYFIEFFIGYFCVNKKFDELSVFFKNEKIKIMTTKTLSKIKDAKFITNEGRKEFMKYFSNSTQILQILQVQTNFIQTLIIINQNFSHLVESVKSVGLEEYSLQYELINQLDNIEEINAIHKEIIEKEKNINFFFIDFMSCVPLYLFHFKENDLEQLIYLITFIEDEKKENTKIVNLNSIEKSLKNGILLTIKNLIKNKNKSINFIEIIPKIKLYFSNFSDNEKFEILQATDINNNNAHTILNLIISEKINIYFENNYSKFFNIITKNIKGFEYLPKIRQIIPKEKYTKEIADKLFNWLINNINNYKSSQQIDIKTEFNKIIEILIEKKSSNIDKIIDKISKSFSDEIIVECYINFIKKNNLPKNISDKIIKFFISKKNQILSKKNKSLLAYILSELKENNPIIQDLLNKLKDNVIKEEEFFRKDLTDNIILLNNLILNNFFNNNNGEDEYSKKTIEIVSSIKSQIEKGMFIYKKAKKILDNIMNASYKFKLLYLSNSKDIQKKGDLLVNKFTSDVIKVFTIISNLEEINTFFSEFYKNSKNNEISKIRDLIYIIKNSKLNEINLIEESQD